MDSRTGPDLSPGQLDSLATTVAEALEEGDEVTAAELTKALEEAAGIAEPSPLAGVVIGRRFSRAHRRLLQRITPEPLACCLDVAG